MAISIEFLAAQAIAAVAAPYLRPNREPAGDDRVRPGSPSRSCMSRSHRAPPTGDFRPTGGPVHPDRRPGRRPGHPPGVPGRARPRSRSTCCPSSRRRRTTCSIDAQRAVALGGTAILLSIGTRRSISALTVTVRRLGTSLARDRRRSRQVAAVESVGRLLAANGPGRRRRSSGSSACSARTSATTSSRSTSAPRRGCGWPPRRATTRSSTSSTARAASSAG